MKVIPPNFGYVEEGIFRCGAPEPRHYGFLASLGLRTCVLLTDTHDNAFVHWLQETGVMIFCPLSSEAQSRQTVRGGPQVYSGNTNGVGEGGAGFPQPRGGGVQSMAGMNNTNSMNNREDGRGEEAASPNGTLADGIGSGSGGRFGAPGNGEVAPSSSAHHDGGDGPEGYEGSGTFNGDDTHASGNGGNGRAGAAAGNMNNNSIISGATASTSNAARFLRANVAERQISTKFSPVLVQEPVYFPGGARGGGEAGAHLVPFASAPSYEGRLHGLMTLSEAVVVSILHIVLDPRYYPLLITCSKGRYRSGIVCGCLRKLQGWNLVSILEEYRRFAGNKSRADNEEFIELFDEELVNLELSEGRRPTILYNV